MSESDFLRLFSSYPGMLMSKTKVHNALMDIYMNDKGLINVLVIAYECIDICQEITKHHPDLTLEKRQWALRLENEYYIQPQAAEKAVNTWCQLFTAEMVKKYSDEKERIKQEEEKEANQKREEAIRIQQIRDEKLQNYITEFNTALSSNAFEEAEEIISSAETDGFTEMLLYKDRITEKKNELEQENKLLAMDKFVSYSEGIRLATSILDQNPESPQVQIWLKNHPRTEEITISKLYFKDGEEQATISWEDDDPYSTYTVCRAEERYPNDPDDGEVICKDTTNKKITDHLPKDRPGVLFHYSIFAVRILDGSWIKADCPGEAIWLPEPKNPKVVLTKDQSGRPAISVSWEKPPAGCAGINVLRYSDEDDYTFPETIADLDDEYLSVQQDCRFIDTNIVRGTKYQYRMRQIWKIGTKQRTSLKTVREITI